MHHEVIKVRSPSLVVVILPGELIGLQSWARLLVPMSLACFVYEKAVTVLFRGKHRSGSQPCETYRSLSKSDSKNREQLEVTPRLPSPWIGGEGVWIWQLPEQSFTGSGHMTQVFAVSPTAGAPGNTL